MTIATQLVLDVLLGDLTGERYGSEIGKEAGLPSGTVHPILARLERVGWLESRWEDIDPSVEGRPARRYYRLTESGAVAARRALSAKARARVGLTLRPQGGTS
ncbi:PadR family transcriptional regulator [Intrasporangium oryzae]|uniref:PadR family transcriptional regulator n=1 Tax=Intrasporangium oryzae TaxID=412687 RepID=UPI00054E28C8|nr:helix-turn-helix transcriptional regulator [Intrasporangium oryzae]